MYKSLHTFHDSLMLHTQLTPPINTSMPVCQIGRLQAIDNRAWFQRVSQVCSKLHLQAADLPVADPSEKGTAVQQRIHRFRGGCVQEGLPGWHKVRATLLRQHNHRGQAQCWSKQESLGLCEQGTPRGNGKRERQQENMMTSDVPLETMHITTSGLSLSSSTPMHACCSHGFWALLASHVICEDVHSDSTLQS